LPENTIKELIKAKNITNIAIVFLYLVVHIVSIQHVSNTKDIPRLGIISLGPHDISPNGMGHLDKPEAVINNTRNDAQYAIFLSIDILYINGNMKIKIK
jgi:hypothetical protein